MQVFHRLLGSLAFVCLLRAFPVSDDATRPALITVGSDDPTSPGKAQLEETGRRVSSSRRNDHADGPRVVVFDEDGAGGHDIYDRLPRKKPSVGTRAPRAPVRPERHEQCDDDRDCRRSPSQICVKHARETSGRCQCPFYRPVEANFNGLLRCVTAKDLFDECRTTEECSATNPNLQCINRLCACPPPHILKNQVDCVSETSIPEMASWAVPVFVVAAATVALAVCFFSWWKKSAAGGTSSSEENDPEEAPAAGNQPAASSLWRPPSPQNPHPVAAPDPRYYRYGEEDGGAGQRGYQESDAPDYSNAPRSRNWIRVPAIRGRRYAQTSADCGSSSTGGANQYKVMWAKQVLQTMASPVYQNKVLKLLMSMKGISGSYPDSSSAEPQPQRFLPGPQRTPSSRYSEVPAPLGSPRLRKAAITMAPMAEAAQKRSSQRQQRPAPVVTCSAETSSFGSFPAHAARRDKQRRSFGYVAQDDGDERAPPAKLRSRDSSRYAPVAPREVIRSRSESSNVPHAPQSPRKVFFANYNK